MAEYLLLFVGLAANPGAADAVTRDYNQQWERYMGDLGRQGKLRAGAPLEPRGEVVAGDRVDDLELQRMDVGGFLVIEAASEDEAIAIAGQAPHVSLGGTTIVRPCVARS